MKQLVVASSLKNLRWKDSWSEDSGLSATTTCADREQSRVEVWFVAYSSVPYHSVASKGLRYDTSAYVYDLRPSISSKLGI